MEGGSACSAAFTTGFDRGLVAVPAVADVLGRAGLEELVGAHLCPKHVGTSTRDFFIEDIVMLRCVTLKAESGDSPAGVGQLGLRPPIRPVVPAAAASQQAGRKLQWKQVIFPTSNCMGPCYHATSRRPG